MFKITSETYPIFNSFKFKNLKYFNSHDGIAYNCELFYGKDKIADVSNDGWGGMTDIHYTKNGEDIINSLNIPQYYKEDLGFDINNEYVISDLVEVAISIKDILKNQTNCILFIDGDNIMQVKYKYSLSKIISAGKGDVILKQIDKIKNDGGVIINTNLSKLGV